MSGQAYKESKAESDNKKQRLRLVETEPLNVSNGGSSAQVCSLHLEDKKASFS